MQFEIDYQLPEAQFRRQIENLIGSSRKGKTVLPLPCPINGGAIEFAALILSQINCDGCDAPCCRNPEYAEFGVPFLPTEYSALVERIGQDRLANISVKLIGTSRYMPTPCPFLHKKMCSIYDIRPFVCVNYPIDISGIDEHDRKMISLDPLCPEARRVAKRVYLTLWKLLNKAQEVYAQKEDLDKGVQQEQTLRHLKRTDTQGTE